MSRQLGAREAYSNKIRAALMTAAGDLIAQQPINGITINNIVNAAEVAKGSFYNHFEDKASLVLAVATEIREEVEQRVADGNKNVTDPAYRIVRGMCHHVRLALHNRRQAVILLRGHEPTTSGSYRLNKNIEKDISDGIKSTRFPPRCDDAGILLIMGATFSTMARIVEQGLTVEQAIELSARTFTLVLCGFGVTEKEAIRIAADSASDILNS